MPRNGEWAVLEAHLPARSVERIAVLLRDGSSDTLRVKIRPDRTADDETEICRELAGELEHIASELGAVQALEWLENSGSHSIRLSDRNTITFTDAQAALETLYIQQVADGLPANSSEAKHSAIRHSTGRSALVACSCSLGLAASIVLMVVRSDRFHPPRQSQELGAETAPVYENPGLRPPFEISLAGLLESPVSLPPTIHRSTAAHQMMHRRKLFHLSANPVVKVRPLIARTVPPAAPALPISAEIPPGIVDRPLPSPPAFRHSRRLPHALTATLRTVAFLIIGRENSTASRSQRNE